MNFLGGYQSFQVNQISNSKDQVTIRRFLKTVRIWINRIMFFNNVEQR